MKTYTHPVLGRKAIYDPYEEGTVYNPYVVEEIEHLLDEKEVISLGFVEDKQEELNTNKIQQAYNEFMRLINEDKQEDIDRDDQFNIIGEYEGKYVIIVKKSTLDKIMKVYGKSLGDLDEQEDWIDKALKEAEDNVKIMFYDKGIFNPTYIEDRLEIFRQAILKHLPIK